MVVSVGLAFTSNFTHAAVDITGRDEYIRAGHIRGTFWAETALLGALLAGICAAGYFYRDVLSGYVGIVPGLCGLVLLYLVVSALSQFLSDCFQITSRMRKFALVPLSVPAVFAALLAWAYLSGRGLNVELVIVFGVIAAAGGMVAGLLFLDKELIWPLVFDPGKVRELVLLSLPYVFSGVAGYVLDWVDLVVIKRFLTSVDVGIYALAYQMTAFLIIFTRLTTNLNVSIITNWKIQGRDDLVRFFVERTVPQVTFVFSLVLVACMTLAGTIFKIFRPEYLPGVPVFVILIASVCFRNLHALQAPVLTAYRIIVPCSVVSLLAVLFNFIADMAMVPVIGIIGPAIATFLAVLFSSLFQTLFIDRRLGTNSASHYFCSAPALAALPVCFLPGIPQAVRLVLGGLIIAISIMAARRAALLKSSDMELYNSMDLPGVISSGLGKISRVLIA
jgi:O-antigen/teichoic acid export membrane protein